MSNLMAGFGDGFVQVQNISENNSVKYKLTIAGSSSVSTPNLPYIRFQNTDIGDQTHTTGINVRNFDLTTMSILERKAFSLTTSDSSANTAFLTYIESITSENSILLLTSAGRLYSSTALDTAMSDYGSVSWPNTFMTSNYYASYAAFYSVKYKKIISEFVLFSDGVDEMDMTTELDLVFDDISDIGSTGFPKYILKDHTEYSSTTLNEIKRYISSSTINLIADYGIEVGDIFYCKADLYADSQLLTDGRTTRFNIRWFNGSSYLSGTTFEVQTGFSDQWVSFERYATVPDTADGFTIAVSRYPSTVTSTGEGKVRNVFFTQVSRADEPLDSPACIGVNGIRMNTAIESGDSLLSLPNIDVDSSGDMYATKYVESE